MPNCAIMLKNHLRIFQTWQVLSNSLSTGEKLLQTFATQNYREAFLNIFMDTGFTLKDLFQVSAEIGTWNIEGFIASQGFSNTSMQFVFVNNR